jgi:hypothetical protein
VQPTGAFCGCAEGDPRGRSGQPCSISCDGRERPGVDVWITTRITTSGSCVVAAHSRGVASGSGVGRRSGGRVWVIGLIWCREVAHAAAALQRKGKVRVSDAGLSWVISLIGIVCSRVRVSGVMCERFVACWLHGAAL